MHTIHYTFDVEYGEVFYKQICTIVFFAQIFYITPMRYFECMYA